MGCGCGRVLLVLGCRNVASDTSQNTLTPGLQIVAILQPAISYQWIGETAGAQNFDVRFTTLALYVGLILGASFWGCSADIIGRKLAWNSTLFIGGVFGIAAGAAPNFTALCALIACIG